MACTVYDFRPYFEKIIGILKDNREFKRVIIAHFNELFPVAVIVGVSTGATVGASLGGPLGLVAGALVGGVVTALVTPLTRKKEHLTAENRYQQMIDTVNKLSDCEKAELVEVLIKLVEDKSPSAFVRYTRTPDNMKMFAKAIYRYLKLEGYEQMK